MHELAIPLSRMVVYVRHFSKEKPSQEFYEMGEGEVIAMNQQQLDQVKSLIGDGLGSVTMSTEMSESDYGTGIKVFCSIKLTCDQSANFIDAAARWAAAASEYYVKQHFEQLKDGLIKQGLLKAPKSGPMFGNP